MNLRHLISLRLQLKPGDKAPDFALPDESGQIRRLADYKGRWLVLFFYPADFTSGCTAESCLFRDLRQDFSQLGADLLGISGDSPESHRRFAEAHKLGYPLLADMDAAMRRAYGVPHILGRLSGRSSFVIDGGGVIRHVFDSRTQAEAHPRAALAWLKGDHGI